MIARRAALAATLAPFAAHAQVASPNAWIVIGFPPGGLGDNVTRPLAERMRGGYAPNVLLDHRPGAGGRIAAEYVRRALPNGMTILQLPSSAMTLYPHIHRDLPYDAFADFVPVTALCTYAYSFTAGPGLPASIRTVAEYVAWARANPRLASYGIPASGSPLHFAGMSLARAANVELTAVPYRGGGPLLQDLLGGQVPVSFNVLTEVLPHVRAGRLRTLALATPDRSPHLPDAPTFTDAGYPGIGTEEWLGWFVPAGTQPATVARLAAAVRDGLRTPEFRDAVIARNALGPLDTSPEETMAMLRRDHARWREVVAATGFTPEG